MISRESLAVTADTVRKAYESTDADRAMDLFEAIIRMIPNEGLPHPHYKAPPPSKISKPEIRNTRGGANKTPYDRLSKSCSSQDRERSRHDPIVNRERIPDTPQLPEEPADTSGRDKSEGPEGGDEVLTTRQEKVYNVLLNHKEGITPSEITKILKTTGPSYTVSLLKGLEKKNLAHQVGQGRGSLWKPSRTPQYPTVNEQREDDE